MSFSSMFGSHFMPGRVWRPKIEVSQDNVGMVPPEEFKVDPYLPAIGTDPFDPQGSVVIPSGRFVSIGFSGGRGAGSYRFLRTDSGKTTVTLHDGLNLTPAGMSINMMFKDTNEFMIDGNVTKYKKGFVAEVPFVLSINNAHGTLTAGDKVTGYWGSTTSTSLPSYLHRGKPVKWNARRVYSVTAAAASAQLALTAAIYPGVAPRVVTVFSSAGIITPTAAVSWDANQAKWVATFSGAGSATATTAIYDFGQDEDQIGGEVMRIQSITDILDRDNFLKWVEYAPSDYLNFPPAVQEFPVTQIGTGSDPDVNSDWETPSTVTAGVSYRVAHYPMSVRYKALIAFKGTLIDSDGNTQTYTNWTILPYDPIKNAIGYFSGRYHNINWRTGVIDLTSNITSVTAIKVLYSYYTDPRQGAASWGAGVLGLTDGRNLGSPTTYAGVPSHLNLSDVVASMRLIVR